MENKFRFEQKIIIKKKFSYENEGSQKKKEQKVPKSSAECLISRTLTFIGM